MSEWASRFESNWEENQGARGDDNLSANHPIHPGKPLPNSNQLHRASYTITNRNIRKRKRDIPALSTNIFKSVFIGKTCHLGMTWLWARLWCCPQMEHNGGWAFCGSVVRGRVLHTRISIPYRARKNFAEKTSVQSEQRLEWIPAGQERRCQNAPWWWLKWPGGQPENYILGTS